MSNTVAKIQIRDDKTPDAKEVLALFERLKWAKMEYRSAERLDKALANSWPVISAWDQDKLVGICRVVSDGEYTAYISDVAVDPTCQGMGIGTALVEKALDHLENYDTITLITSLEKVTFWEKFGFTNFTGGMMIRRW